MKHVPMPKSVQRFIYKTPHNSHDLLFKRIQAHVKYCAVALRALLIYLFVCFVLYPTTVSPPSSTLSPPSPQNQLTLAHRLSREVCMVLISSLGTSCSCVTWSTCGTPHSGSKAASDSFTGIKRF